MARKLAKKQPTTFRFEELEQRILFSADIAPGLDTAAVDEQVLAEEQSAEDLTDTTAAADAVDQNNEEPRRELVFVNENVADYEQLLADLQRGDDNRVIEVVGLESDRDGIEQVSDILSERTDLSAVHFITHGADGQLNLGRSWLNSASLQQNSEAVSAWGNALNETGDILLYGCNIAANGNDQNLADTLASLTGADVVASDDITGHEDLGGDWNLEYASGPIETSVAVSGAAQSEYEAVLTTFIVDNTNDSGAGSLRQAILDANANANSGGPDLITFNIGADGSQQTINLLSALDPISEAVIIDGFSQYGALTPTNPLIEINGAGTINDGLSFASTSDGSVVQGLMITGFSQFGIQVDSGADGISILGNWIGTTGTGSTGDGNGNTGINVQGANTVIGGTGINDGNVITNNGNEGINVTGSGATGTIIQGNIIGLDPDGASGSGNADVGIALLSGAHNTTIGGSTAAARNIISNNFEGIEINSDSNVVQGNYIGTDISGTLDRGNHSDDGIEIQGSASNNLIGGFEAGEGNLVEFNDQRGISTAGSGSGNQIIGNTVTQNVMSGIHSFAAGTEIIGNVIFANSTGFTFDELVLGNSQTVYHNTIHGAQDDGISVEGANAVIRNNIITGSSGFGIRIAGGSIALESHNLVTDAVTGPANLGGQANFALDASDLNEDPLYLNAGAGDFRLSSPANPAIDAGVDLGGAQPDVNGAGAGLFGGIAPDMGTFESWAPIVDNSAPVLAGANDLANINEDDFSNSGTLVSDLISGQVTDVDSGAIQGIAVIAVDDTNGTWQYTTDGGSNWTAFGAVNASTARLLTADANTSVRFVPDASWSGTVTNGITFHAWDQTSGTNGGTADLTNTDSVLDQFTSASYANNHGSQTWSTNWVESDSDGGGASSGFLQITGGELQITADAIGDSIYRQADLSGATTATLTFDYRSELVLGDIIFLQVSANGGGSYTTVETFSNSSNTGTGSISLDISAYIASNTRIRFIINDAEELNNLYIDNVQIEYTTGSEPIGASSAFSDATASSSIHVNQVGSVSIDNTTPAQGDVLTASVSDADGLTGASIIYQWQRDGVAIIGATGSSYTTEQADVGAVITVVAVYTDDQGTAENVTSAPTAAVTDVNDAPTSIQVVETAGGGLTVNADGGNDTYLLADSGLGAPLSRFTVEVQFEGGSDSTEVPFISYNTGSGDILAINTMSDNTLELDIGTGSEVFSSAVNYNATLMDGQRHTLSVSWDNTAGDWSVYIDGALVDSGTGLSAGQTIPTGGTLMFGLEQDSVGGNFESQEFFNGTLHDIRLFDDVRTAVEIDANKETTLAPTTANLIANWQFDNLSTNGVVTESVGGNNLTVQHTNQAGFTSSDPVLSLVVDENTVNGTVVGQVKAIDVDAGDTHSYTITTGNTDGAFAIDANGTITVANSSSLDYETNPVFTLTIQATDDGVGNLSGSSTVTISLNNVNETPIAIGESYTAVEGVPFSSELGLNDLLQNDSDPDGDTLTVNTTSVSGPANGELILNADGTFSYTPNDNFNGSDSFVYEVLDGNGGIAQATVTITVQQREIRILFSTQSDVNSSKVPGIVNWDAGDVLGIGDPNLSFEPVGSDGSILPFFDLEGFADSSDMTINGLHFVSNDLTVGSDNSIDLQRGDILFVSASDDVMRSTNTLAITGGDVIVFRPDVAEDYTAGTFIHLLDQPGTNITTGITLIETDVLIGDITLTAGSFLFTQENFIEESSIYHHSAADVGAGTTDGVISTLISSVDIGVNWNNFVGVMVVNEDLYLDGTMVPAGSIVTTLANGDDSVGNNGLFADEDNIIYLTVTSTTMGSGTTTADATLLFDAGEVGLNNNQKKIRSFSIIEEISAIVNVDPEITLSAGTNIYTEGDPETVIDPAAVLVDPDSSNFDGGVLSVNLGTSGFSNDTLSIRNEGTLDGQIGVSGNDVTYGGTIIGNYSGGSNGGEPLVVIFNVNADVTAIQALLRNITYENTSNNPAETQRTVNFTITDGDGGVSNTASRAIVVNNVNFAPVLTGANNLTAIDEDVYNSGGTLVSILISGWVADADLGSVEGIAVTNVDNTNGSWEFSIDGGTSWTAFGSPDSNNARHIAANPDSFIRFVPNPDWNGTVTNGITFHAWDQTSGINGDIIDLTNSNNLRDQFDTVSLSNNDGSAVWTSDWTEDNDDNSAATGNIRIESGKLRLDDLDGGSKESIVRSFDLSGAASAVLTFDYDGFGEGGLDVVEFEVSNNGGSSWVSLESVDVVGNVAGSKSYNLENYTLLTADMQLRFSIVKGLDATTQHINFDNVDIAYSGTGVGGSTSVSVASASSSITVNPVNDAPVANDDPGNYAGELLSLNPLSYWRLGEAIGSAADIGSSANNGSYNGGTLGQTGAIAGDSDTALHFDATNSDYVSVTHSDDYLLDDGTVQLWFNAETAANGSQQHLFSKDSMGYDTGGHLSIYLDASGHLEARLQSTSQSYFVTSPVAVTEGEWHNAAISFGADGMVLYLDGQAVDTNVYTGGLGTTSGGTGNHEPIAIGGGTQNSDNLLVTPVNELFTGLIDEVAILDGQLSAATISALYDAGQECYAVDEDSTLTVSSAEGVLINDFDADGDSLTVIEVNGSSLNVGSPISLASGALVTLNADGSMFYDPNGQFEYLAQDQTATDTFTYVANDGTVDSDPATVTISIFGVNDAPTVAAVDLGSINEDGSRLITQAELLTGGTDDDGDALSAANLTLTSGSGTLTDHLDGTWTFSPSADWNGAVGFGFEVTDGIASVANTASLSVTPVNDNPTVESTIADQSLSEDFASYTIDLNAAFDDVETADVDLVYGVSGNTNINVSISGGIATITTTADWHGNETLTFTATDAGGLSISQDVAFTVAAVVDIADDTDTTNEDTAVTTNVLTNDSFEGTPVITAITQGANGSVAIVDANAGTISYTPNANFNGTDSYTYTITSGGVTETATVTVTVNPVNDPTIITGGTSGSGDEDTTINGTLTATDNDGLTDGSVFAVTGAAANGSATIDAGTGAWSYTPNADYNGNDSFTVTITDDADNTTTQVISLSVAAIADIADDTDTTNEDTAVTTNVLTNDSFEGTPVITAITQGANGSVAIVDANAGTISYTPNANFNGTDSYTYTITSGGVTETATVTVTVDPVNDPTIITGGTSGSGDEDTTINGTLTATDNDGLTDGSVFAVTGAAANGSATIDAGTGAWSYTPNADYNGNDSFTVTITDDADNTTTQVISLSVAAVVDIADDTDTTNEDTAVTTNVLTNDSFEGTPVITAITQGANGSVAIVDANAGTISYTPNANFNGTDSYTYTITSGGVTETATVTVTVNPVNDPTIITGGTSGSGDEDTTINGTLTATDNDGLTDGSVFAVTGAAANGSATIDAGTGAWSYTPNADYNGNDSFTVTITDDADNTTTQVISLSVAAIADIADDTDTTNEDTAVTTNVLTNDSFEGTPVITAITQGANGSVAIVDANAGTISYTPNANFNGTDSYTYTITSGGVTETATVTVTVDPVNDPTIITGGTSGSGDEDTTINGTLTATDNDGLTDGSVFAVTGAAANGSATIDAGTGAWSYTPNADYNGNDSFTVTITDDADNTTTQVISLSVAAIADIADDTDTTNEDTAVTTNVLTNDSFEGTPVITAITQGANGSVAIVDANAGTISYTPNANFNGTDSYTYTITSGGVTETATVTVTVDPVNDPTIITGGTSGSGDEDTTINGTLTATDNDGLTDGSVFAVTGAAANGSATIDAGTGAWSYTPNADYNGNDSFTVTITDDADNTTTQVISLSVAAIADIADDTDTTNEDTAVTTNVLTNDSFEGTPVITAITQGANGSVAIVDANAGTISYTPNANFNGTDSYTYTITSGGVTETATVTVTVDPVNDPTIITGGTSGSGDEDTTINGTLTATDNDGLTDGSVFAVTGAAANGSATIDAGTGAWSYTPNADYNGNDSFTVTITDDADNTTTQVISLSVAAIADIADDTDTTNEDTAVTTNVLTNDSFEGTPVITAITQGANGSVAIVDANAGTISYTPNANFNGTDSYTYTITSGGVTETATVTVTVDPVNDPTIITGGTSGSGDEDTTINGTLTATDNDGLTDGSVFAVTGAAANGSATIDAGTGAWSYTPNADYNGNDSFTVTITDDADNTTTQVISLSVAAVVDIADDTDTTNEDTAVTTNVLTNDSFEGTPVITAITQGANGSVAIVDANAGTISYTPNANFNGTDSYTYTITSGGVTETATVTVTVDPVNDPTIITGGTSGSGDEDTTINGTLTATDNDGLTDGSVFAVTGAAANGSATIDAGTGAWSYTPNADYNGNDSFTVTITDDADNTTTQVISLSVAAVVDIADDTDTTNEDTAVTTNVLANDSFEGTPVITAITQGANGSVAIVDANAGTISYTPNANFNGTDSYTYTITSGGVTETATVTVTVDPVNDPTIITGGTSGSGDEDTTINGTLTATDNDGLTDGSVFAVTGAAANGSATIDAGTGAWSYTPNADYNGNDSFTVTITDDADNTTTQVISLSVAAIADIADDTDTTNEDTAVTTNVLTNDSFEGTPVITAITQGANGSVAIVDANAGTISYTPNANFNGTDSYTYTITSGGVTETATVTVTVNPVNDPTIITGGTSGSGDEDTTINGTLTATDNDGLTDGSVFAVTGAAANGSATIDAGTGAWSYTPNADYNGNDSFTVTITDDADNTTTQVISLSVAAVVDIADDTDTTNEDTAVTTNVLTNDSFEGTPVITAITQGANGSVAIVDANAGTISYTPNANFNGTDSYTYTITSGGVTETATVTVTVDPVNDPTIITGGTSGSGDEDTTINGTLTATDNDGLTDGSVFAVTGAAANGSATIDAGTGAWSYTPNADYNGNDSFTVTITDDADNTTTQVISLSVAAIAEEENLPDNNDETPTDPEPDTGNETPTDTSPDEDLPGNEVTEATLPPVKGYPTDNLPLMNDPEGSEPTNDILYLTDEDDTQSEILRNRDDLIYYDNDLYKEISAAKHLNFNYKLPEYNDTPDDFSNIDFENDALKHIVDNGDYDQFRKEIDDAFSSEQYSESMKANLITLTTTTFTIGFVSYLLRAGALLASLISTYPIWHGFDPIVIFARKKKKRDQNDVDESDEPTVDTFFNGKSE